VAPDTYASREAEEVTPDPELADEEPDAVADQPDSAESWGGSAGVPGRDGSSRARSPWLAPGTDAAKQRAVRLPDRRRLPTQANVPIAVALEAPSLAGHVESDAGRIDTHVFAPAEGAIGVSDSTSRLRATVAADRREELLPPVGTGVRQAERSHRRWILALVSIAVLVPTAVIAVAALVGSDSRARIHASATARPSTYDALHGSADHRSLTTHRNGTPPKVAHHAIVVPSKPGSGRRSAAAGDGSAVSAATQLRTGAGGSIAGSERAPTARPHRRIPAQASP
jgi:hypothetical protein